MPDPEVIDVDAISDDNDDIKFQGFFRNIERTRQHVGILEQEGVVYAGFRNSTSKQKALQKILKSQEKKVISLVDEEEHSDHRSDPSAASAVPDTSRNRAATSSEVFIIEGSSEDEPVRAAPKRQDKHADISASPPAHDPDIQPDLDLSPVVDNQVFHGTELSSSDVDDLKCGVDNHNTSDIVIYEISEDEDEALIQGVTAISLSGFSPQHSLMPLWDVSSHGFDSVAAFRTSHNGRPHTWSKIQSFIEEATYTGIIWNKKLRSHTLNQSAPGAINNIAQSNGIIAIASAVTDGAEDDPDEPISSFNCDGSLMVWYKGEVRILSGHERNNAGHGASPLKRYYTVNDVKFDPTCPTTLVSSGYDQAVHIWDLEPLEGGMRPNQCSTVPYNCVPGTILFKPEESLLAVAGSNGHVYLQSDAAIHQDLSIAGRLAHTTTGILWGQAHSKHLLFASSCSRGGATGVHKMFDVNKGTSILKFDASEAGQKLAVNDLGEQLAIAVEGPAHHYSLRFYDIRRRNKLTTHRVILEPLTARMIESSEDTREINGVVFSPDSLYLVVARGDNTLHVYDTRKLNSGPLYIFRHDVEVSIGDTYGVVQAQWVEGTCHERGIVSGGADGCIRLWDVRKAGGDPHNGKVIAQHSDDIGCFSLGDSMKGELPLVVGECSGKVSIFDRQAHRQRD